MVLFSHVVTMIVTRSEIVTRGDVLRPFATAPTVPACPTIPAGRAGIKTCTEIITQVGR
ncbi:MAG: hypothetical protein HOP29_18125 [Phycisphaerales bacterium]|nr:hypothetical protein [Phycisphaerales bacterium]